MDIYGAAWKNLERKIASSRRRSLTRADLIAWQLEALEKAVDEIGPLTRGVTQIPDSERQSQGRRPDADFRDS
ncbi:hypothetical protein LCGC14_0665470 [marine sediment metagenome]|uniref:Uncharacterized protein n=1 Tax=marine sediment metagenome TaxID=412755 RepID=A0A0F9TDW8_9ZZZZ